MLGPILLCMGMAFGCVLMVIGHQSRNAPGQSADARVGGAVSFLAGIAVLVINFLFFMILLAVG